MREAAQEHSNKLRCPGLVHLAGNKDQDAVDRRRQGVDSTLIAKLEPSGAFRQVWGNPSRKGGSGTGSNR